MPRTDTSDPSNFPVGGLYRLTAVRLTGPQGSVFANGLTGINIIVVAMDCVSEVSGTSTAIEMGVFNGQNSQTYGVFGAETGAGQFDTFSWRGFLALQPLDSLSCLAATGTWSFVATGYNIPQP